MAPGPVGNDHEALRRCRSLDWPLSREEKKGRVMQLYEDEVRAVELLLESREHALEALEADVAARVAEGQDAKAVSSRGFRQRRHSAKHTVKRSAAWANAPVGANSRWTPWVTVSAAGSIAPGAWEDADSGPGLPDAISCLGSAPPAPGAAAEIQDFGVSRSGKLPAAASCSSLLSEPPLHFGDLRQLIRYGGAGKEVTANAQKSSGPETRVDTDMQPHAAASGEAEAVSAAAAGHSSSDLRWWPAGETGGLAAVVQHCKGGATVGGLGQQSLRVSFSSGGEVSQGLASDQGDCRVNHESFPQISWKPSLARTWTPRALPSPCRSQQPIGSGL